MARRRIGRWLARRSPAPSPRLHRGRSEQLAALADPLLDRAVYRRLEPPFLAELADSGAVGLNARWERGASPSWRIEVQRPGADLVQAGALRRDDGLRGVGWHVLDWGLLRQAPDGSFPGSEGLPRHTTAFFVEALARAVLVDVTVGRDPGPERSQALASAAHWLATAPSPADDAKNDELVHRWWLVAAALATSGQVLGDGDLTAAAGRAADRAVAGTGEDGAITELGGFDVRYQAMGVLFGTRYLLAAGPQGAAHRPVVTRSLDWLRARIAPDGTVELTGSTRSGHELTPSGHPKVVDLVRTFEALVLGAHACGRAEAREAAGWLEAPVAVAARAAAADGALAERPRRLAFTFVCQAGALEPQAILLAASLHGNLAAHHEVVAAVPTPAEVWGAPAPETLAALADLGVRVEPILNELGPTFPHANKIACLTVPTDADVRVFLDTDMVCLRPVDDDALFTGDVAAKPADEQAYTDDPEVWRATYAAAGVALPTWQTVTTTSRAAGPPFFNTGFLAVAADLGPALAATWTGASAAIRAADALPHHRTWSDQLGFAVTLADHELSPTSLGVEWNHPVHHRRLEPDRLPRLAHYHWPDLVRQEPTLRAVARDLAERQPAFARAAAAVEGWPEVLAPSPVPSGRGRPELLITGISRSGTSYLCKALHRYSNCVVINEPDDIHPPLHEPLPWRLTTFLREVRADVVDGRPIRNKLVGGEVTEDTAVDQRVGEYCPAVDDDGFVLGVKNTLAFLHHLDRIRSVLPDVRVAICVRDPLDTIASWKRSFPHLHDVDLSVRPHAHPDDAWLPAASQERLREIVALEPLAWRRARYWAFLAEQVLAHLGSDHVHLVHYDALVSDPVTVIGELTEGWEMGRLRQPLEPSPVRGNRSLLDAEDRRAIRAVCGTEAAELGLSVA